MPPHGIAQPSRNVSLVAQQFAVQYGGAGPAANWVVGKDGKSPVEDIARPPAAHHRRHSVSAIPIQPRLRAVRRTLIDYGLLGRRVQLEFLPPGLKLTPSRNHI